MKKILLTLVSLSLVFGADALAAVATNTSVAITVGGPLPKSATPGLQLPSPLPNPVPPIKTTNSDLRTINCDGNYEHYKAARYIHDTRQDNITRILSNEPRKDKFASLSNSGQIAITQENLNYEKLRGACTSAVRPSCPTPQLNLNMGCVNKLIAVSRDNINSELVNIIQ